MVMGDRIPPKAQEVRGKVEQAARKAADNDRLEAEGHADGASAKMKHAAHNAGDAARDALDS